MTHRIVRQFKVFQQELESLRKDYLKALTDTSIPLDERYEMLKSAPVELRDDPSSVFTFGCVNIEWCEEYERHQTIWLTDIIDNLERNGILPQYVNWSVVDGNVRYADHDWSALIPLMKEELLAANCVTCTFDW